MKKTVCLAFALVMLLSAAGCGRNNRNDVSAESSKQIEKTITENETALNSESGNDYSSEVEALEKQYEDEHLSGLRKNEYEGIEMTAAVLPRMALLTGSAIPVTVTIKNTGDKTIAYTHGSGAHQTPSALSVRIPELQPVMPRDYLGIATMDMVTKELKPDETLEFTTTVMAVKPNVNFDVWTHEYYGEGDDRYIGDLAWQDLQERYPELESINPGSYEGHIYFAYYVLGENGVENPMGQATEYAQADFTIGITE